MKNKLTVWIILSAMICSANAMASVITPVYLGDTTVENLQTGYSNNPHLENLEYWFSQSGITNVDGTSINPLVDQLQIELFHTTAAANITTEFLGIGYASYHSPFGVYTYNGDPTEPFNPALGTYMEPPLFVQNETPDNSFFNFTLAPDTYFGFYLNSNGSGTLLGTMIASNPDNLDHAIVFETNKGYTIAFEDIVGGGDFDYEDLVVNITGAAAVPEPASMLLIGAGLTMLAGSTAARKRRIRQQI